MPASRARFYEHVEDKQDCFIAAQRTDRALRLLDLVCQLLGGMRRDSPSI